MTTNYRVEGMRILLAENRKNADIALTVKGIFYDATDGRKLSFQSKDVTKAQAANSEFAVDMSKGTLTLPAGRRGRVSVKGISQDKLNSYLDSLRKPTK